MKKYTLIILIPLFFSTSNSFASNIIYPVRQMPVDDLELFMDNPKGKLKIRFVRNEDKSTDSTDKPKGFFGKLKNVVNMILDASDNPPFKVEIVREKEKKN
jgi:hypothetical protein